MNGVCHAIQETQTKDLEGSRYKMNNKQHHTVVIETNAKLISLKHTYIVYT